MVTARGRGGGRYLRARLAPLTPRCVSVGSPSMITPRREDAPDKCIHVKPFAGAPWSPSGGVFCRPVSAPAQESQQKWGVSDPAGASHPRPRGRSAGSLTPHMSVSVMCWGACLMAAESAL